MGMPDAALAEVPWASRVWALPFVCALAPSERYAQERGRRHKSLTEWAWQMLWLVRRSGSHSERSWPSQTVGMLP
jgi:hypothetical protein